MNQQQPAICESVPNGLYSSIHVTTISQKGEITKHLYHDSFCVSFRLVGLKRNGIRHEWITRSVPRSTGSPSWLIKRFIADPIGGDRARYDTAAGARAAATAAACRSLGLRHIRGYMTVAATIVSFAR